MRRRQLLHWTAGTLPLWGCGPAFQELCDELGTDDPLDHVLAAFHDTDPEFADGLSNHGPMVIEVLGRSGRASRICQWAGGYIGHLDALPAAQPIGLDDQPAALGDATRSAAWIETYLALTSGDLQAMLSAAWPSLLPSCAAFHGVLRTGHALRALAESDTPVRRRELAHGLGYWSARQELLPGSPGSSPVGGLDVVRALDRLSILPPDEQQSGGLIKTRLAKLSESQAFADEIAQVDLQVWPVERTLSELAAAVARLFVAHEGRQDLGYLHAFDVTSILRSLLPWMDEAAQVTALGFVYQAVAAVHATHAAVPGVPQLASSPSVDAAAVVERVSDSDEEHTLKLVDALLLEHGMNPRPELLRAAELRLG